MDPEHVILLHGLTRTSRSLRKMAAALGRAGYVAWNVDYPSRTAPIEVLSENAIGDALVACRNRGATRVHFVTHSLGGILVRSYFARHRDEPVGRVVMLAPPNQGSEVVDRLRSWWLFRLMNGPAGAQLGTEAASVPNRLGPPRFELGVIAGSRSINLILSSLIPGRNDGKVSIERTKLPGMADHLTVPSTHPFIMRNPEVIWQTLQFLQTGAFSRVAAPNTPSISRSAFHSRR